MADLSETLVSVTSQILVFCLVFGLAATVDTACFKHQIANAKAIMTGVFLQFVLMPFLGFAVVKSLEMDYVTGLMILVVCCSPGGSYSNWWCSLFNADLALSVTMTAVSTLCSVVMLPFNLYVYTHLIYNDDVIYEVKWGSLFLSIFIIIIAIGLGFLASYHYNSHDFNLNANRLGNFAGIALVIFSLIMSSSNSEYQLWDRTWTFYLGVAMPCVFGLLIANAVTTGLWLLAPERVTVSIECCYQNVGVALAVASAIFDGDKLAEAIGVPVYYGAVEAIIVSIYCVWAWKNGWTKAPTDASLWQVLTTSYEVKTIDEVEQPQDDGVQVPSLKVSENTDEKEAWDYVDYGDAEVTKPQADTKEASDSKKWFSFV